MRTFTAVVAIAVCLAGCGSNDPFDYTQVHGKVTYADGTPIPAATLRLTFVPLASSIDKRTHARPGVAEVNVDDGTFSTVTSHRYGDGLVPGIHKVTVVALDANQTPTTAVPDEYSSEATTPLQIETSEQPLTILVRKPES